MSKQTILFVHQSSELYGSDKTLLYLVRALNSSSLFSPIVVLPSEGPLTIILKKEGIRVILTPIIKVSRKMFKLKNLISLPFITIKSIKNLEKELKNEKIDLIHSNTLAVLLGAFYAKKRKIKHLWHVHEIIEHPKAISKIYPIIVDKFSEFVVFNSNSSKAALCKNRETLKMKSQVVWNGLDREEPISSGIQINRIRETIFKANSKNCVIGLIGRINRWKGHLLLLEAFKELLNHHNNIKLVFIGSPPPNQDFFLDTICSKIESLNLTEHCEIIPFEKNVWPLYDSLDIVVVPSTEPEPFGLVAIEAMLSKKVVIAANHGGLSEIIEHNKTGLLFKPNDVEDLINCLTRVLNNNAFSNQIANAGQQVSKKAFSLENYLSSFKRIYLETKTCN
jgi:glycosyltransferase involved in cell wall biosynthesis